MALHQRYSSSPDADAMEKHVQEQTMAPVDSERTIPVSDGKHNSHLHRGLKARHITMIAIGGAIGQ
jgi:yeast amino acid transporter